MKKLMTIAALAVVFTVNAQVIKYDPKTGDTKTDQILKEIDAKAKKDQETFAKEVSTKFGIVKTKVDQMIQIMSPGDVYMAAQTAEITKKPIDDVTKSYQANKDKGWGAIAKDLGVKPGSPEFHALKNKVKEHGNSGKSKGNKGGKAKSGGKGKGGDDDHGKDHAEQGKDHDNDNNAPKENKGGGKGKGKGKGKD